MRRKNILYALFFFGFIFFIFRNWFLAPQIIGGDWPYFFEETLKNYSFFFSSWNPFENNGLGGISPIYSLGIFHGFTVFLSQSFHIPWSITYKISWFGLFLFFSSFSSLYLLKTIFSRISFSYALLASVIYATNTYILMVVGGGQMGVALAYSLVPLVIAFFIKIINLAFIYSEKRATLIRSSVLSGIALSVELLFDPRIVYLTILVIGLYFLLKLMYIRKVSAQPFIYVFLIPGIIVVALHAVWIIPLMITRINPISVLGDAYDNVGMVKFLSFASFYQSFSLLHPNWPENIFGKTYFMHPEFILIPILAFFNLLFIQTFKDLRIKMYILFLAILGLIGTFLAKGANPPFGDIYLWLFKNIPGFVMFRDPTKFYLLVILSYSMLMPLSLEKISEKVLSIKHKILNTKVCNMFYLIPFVFIIFWAFLIYPAIFGQLKGTFSKQDVPKEYVELKDFLYNQKDYFRTLWVPRQQRFSFISNIHPSIEAEPLFSTRSAEEISKKVSSKQTQSLLSELSVKYIVIPYDSLGEQFLEDRKYSEKSRSEYEKVLDAVPWLKKIRSDKITVYETPFEEDHFFFDKAGTISAVMVNPAHYILTVSIDQPQNLTFSETYNSFWILKKSQETIYSKKTKNNLNSFWLDKTGKYTVDILFSLENYYEFGRIISALTIIVLVVCLIKLRKK